MSDIGRDQSGRTETELDRADRDFGELLQEVRVMQAGVQILFAFPLTIPLQARFSTLDDFQRGVLLVTLLILVAAITALLLVMRVAVPLVRRSRLRRLPPVRPDTTQD